MLWLVAILGLVVAIFLLTVLFGPPFLRTHKKPVETALDVLKIKKGSHLLDMGSGDGSVLLAAAKRGANATGYEINPFLALICIWRTRKYHNQVNVVWGNMWRAPIDEKTQNIYIFPDVRILNKLDRKISESGQTVTLATYSYELPNHSKTDSRDGVNIYSYRAIE